MPVGMAFGILSRGLGFTLLEACLCSATAIAGAGQFIALSFLAAGAGPVSVLISTTVVNLRYVLFASTLSTYVRDASTLQHAALGFVLTDETFAINVADDNAIPTSPSLRAPANGATLVTESATFEWATSPTLGVDAYRIRVATDAAKLSIPILNRAGIAMISPANTYIGLTNKGQPGEPDEYYPTGKRNRRRLITQHPVKKEAQNG